MIDATVTKRADMYRRYLCCVVYPKFCRFFELTDGADIRLDMGRIIKVVMQLEFERSRALNEQKTNNPDRRKRAAYLARAIIVVKPVVVQNDGLYISENADIRATVNYINEWFAFLAAFGELNLWARFKVSFLKRASAYDRDFIYGLANRYLSVAALSLLFYFIEERERFAIDNAKLMLINTSLNSKKKGDI